MAWLRLTLCTSLLSFSSLGLPEDWRPGEGFVRVGGAWVQDVHLPGAARLQRRGAVGPLHPGEPRYWMFASNGNFGGSSNGIWTYNWYVWRYSVITFPCIVVEFCFWIINNDPNLNSPFAINIYLRTVHSLRRPAQNWCFSKMTKFLFTNVENKSPRTTSICFCCLILLTVHNRIIVISLCISDAANT